MRVLKHFSHKNVSPLFISISLHFLFHLLSSLSSSLLSLFSSLVSSLLSHRLLSSCLVSSSLVLSCVVSLSLSLFLCLSPCDVVCCVVWCVSLWPCCWWSWCVFDVCVCCGTLKKRGKKRIWLEERLRVYIRNVPVYAGTTRTCVETCAWCRYTRRRFERTHGDVLNPHTGGRGVIVSSAHPNLPTHGYHVLQKFTTRNRWIFPIFKFEN